MIKRILMLALAGAVGYRMGAKKGRIKYTPKFMEAMNDLDEYRKSTLTEGKMRRGGVKPKPKNQRPDVKPIPQKPKK